MKRHLSDLFHSRDKPTNAVRFVPSILYVPIGAGKSVSVHFAIQISAEYANVHVIA